MDFRRIEPKNIWGHFKTITEHRHQVIKHCFKAGIPVRGLLHDLSKYSPAEFIWGAMFYTGTHSPNVGEREVFGHSKAWMHHQGRNKHHFEYWNDYHIDGTGKKPVKMPLKYVVEMFCDRVAASKIYLKDDYNNSAPFSYFDKGRPRRFIHPETEAFLEKLLIMLREKGEDYTFRYLRFYLLNNKNY